LCFLLSACTEDNEKDTPDAGPAVVEWAKHIVGAQSEATYIYSEDVDADGLRDIVCTNTDHMAAYQSEIAWYKNNAVDDNWEKVVVWASNADPVVYNATGVIVADIDGDGHQDIVSAASKSANGENGCLYWFKANDGATGTWQKFDIAIDSDDRYYKVYTFDPDGDDDLDIVVGGRNAAYLYVNPGNPAAQDAVWTRHAMPEGTGLGIFLTDMNNDGAFDVLSANRDHEKVSWVEVGWDETTFSFEEHIVIEELENIFDATSMDINEDGRPDVVVSKIWEIGVHWLEAPATDSGDWILHDLDPNLYATDLYPGDINEDGKTDLVMAAFAMAQGPEVQLDAVVWYEHSENEGQTVWNGHDIEEEPEIVDPGDISARDMDNDGDLDVVTTSYTDGEVLWYENLLR
jgi:hypothetical protein